jgi:arsenite methyltransferase
MPYTAQTLIDWYSAVPRDGLLVSRGDAHFPKKMKGMTILVIGCRNGRSVEKAAEKVGAGGMAVGMDWDGAFISEALGHQKAHAKSLGLKVPNTDYRLGLPEDLATCGFPDECMDLVFVDSVLNLTYDPERVLSEIHRVLKKGGVFYHDTVVADQEIPAGIRRDEARSGNSVGAALTAGALDFLLERMGFTGVAHLDRSVLELADRPKSVEHEDDLVKVPFTLEIVSALKSS